MKFAQLFTLLTLGCFAAAPLACAPSAQPGSADWREAVQEAYDRGSFADAAAAANAVHRRAPANQDALVSLARTYLAWGNQAKENDDKQSAKTKYQAGIKFWKRCLALGELPELEYVTGSNLLMATGNHGQAIEILNDRLVSSPDSLPLRLNLALVNNLAGRYTEAFEITRGVIEDHPGSTAAHWRMAYVLLCVGRYGLAFERYEKAMALSGDAPESGLQWEMERCRSMLAEEKTFESFWYHYKLANQHSYRGRTDRDAAECGKALEILLSLRERNQIGDRLDWYEPRCHKRIAQAMELAGEYEQAYAQKKRATESMRRTRNPMDLVFALSDQARLGMRYASKSVDDESREREVLEEVQDALDEAHEIAGHVRNKHQEQHLLAMRVKNAHHLYGLEDARFTALREEMVSQIPPKPGSNCAFLTMAQAEAILLFEEEKYEASATRLEQVVAGYANQNCQVVQSGRMELLFSLMNVYRRLGREDEVVNYGRTFLQQAGALRASLSDDASKRKLLQGYFQAATATTAAALVATGKDAQAFNATESYKGRSLLELLRGKALMEPARIAPEPTPQQPAILAKASADDIEREDAAAPPSGWRDLQLESSGVTRLAEDRRVSDRVISSLGTDCSARLVELTPMMGDFNLVSYVYNQYYATAFVLHDEGVTAVPLDTFDFETYSELLLSLADKFDVRRTDRRDLAVESGVEATAPTPDPVTELEALYDMLLAPVIPHLDKTTVYVCADGVMNHLPFEILQKNGRYFVEDYAVAYTPSATFLKWLLDKPHADRARVFALGNPNLRNPEYRLAHAGEEAEAVRALFPEGTVVLGNAATETAVLAEARRADVLHLACHGEVNADNPMLTSLRLAPDDDNDGYLHAGEIFDMQLSPSLVVLSACNSGIGEITDGNELMGLTRSFFYAGAQSIIASVWFVDDRSTSELMQNFYTNLQDMNTVEALRQAKLTVMTKYPDPIHWAPFCLHGDYR